MTRALLGRTLCPHATGVNQRRLDGAPSTCDTCVGMVSLAGSILLAAVIAQPSPDSFTFFRERVEPIFLAKREGHARCIACHQHRAQFHLEPLSPGETTWSLEQSRRNFETARRLVNAGDPAASRLLRMALAEEEGGTPFHPGGKHFETLNDPAWQTMAEWVATLAPAPLDFEVFRERVEPILLAKHEGRARCVVCHQHRAQFHLQPVPPEGERWSIQESRRNFDVARRLVAPGDPGGSRLLRMPLAEGAGGTAFHPGGKRWESTDDPEWQAIANWVKGSR